MQAHHPGSVKSKFCSHLVIIICLISTMLPSCTRADKADAFKSGLEVYIVKPITKQKILPDTPTRLFPIAGKPDDRTIIIKACRAEFEPASFVLRASSDVDDISITTSNLTGPNGSVISSSSIDARLVKCWYQAGVTEEKGNKVLVPELLLKDETLVKVDTIDRKNYLKVNIGGNDSYIDVSTPDAYFPKDAKIFDAKRLLPFDMKQDNNKQVWLTFHAPAQAVIGRYQGNIVVRSGTETVATLKVDLKILPFELQPSAMEYGLYYMGLLQEKASYPLHAQYKTQRQYLLEHRNMKNHGVLYPTLYQPYDAMLKLSLLLRKGLGLPVDKVYSYRVNTESLIFPSNSELQELKRKIYKWKDLTSKLGYKEFYIYGKDEAKGDALLAQRPAWEAAHDAGAKIFASCYKGAVDVVGDLLDLPILSGSLKPEETEKWHRLGKRVFVYGNPQVGIEDPEIYRRNYGIAALCKGYDGVMNFAYQYAFGHIWNDFDNPGTGKPDVYRDHVFAYPTSDGVIDTIQWEGFREAVDDVRYLTTLAKIENSPDYRFLCGNLTQGDDLDLIRETIAARILPSVIHSPSD